VSTWPTAGISFGGDYNPEQWHEQVQVEDIALMREAGVNFVSVGIFSWGLLEPRPEVFEFDWLDRAMDRLAAAGIRVDLATATASPPTWMSRLYPEALPVDRSGNRFWHGSRQTYCPSSPVYAELSLRLVDRLAQRYAAHPALAMWHVSNELGCHNVHCYCDVSAAAFRAWLQRRYGADQAGLESLNDAWGTVFWSQHYSDWRDVLPPRTTTALGNPTQELDFWRFSSDELLGIYRRERNVLRAVTPDIPVTTNFMTLTHTRGMDYWAWAPEMDIVSTDHYLDGRLARPEVELSWSADLTRGLAGRNAAGSPWLLMEHSTSAVNWQNVNLAKAPGQLMRNSVTHLARGADGIAFFQWRASQAGAEKFHSALLPHAGTNTKVWREVVELGTLLGRLDGVRGTTVRARAAIIFDYDSQWAAGMAALPSALLDYDSEQRRWYGAFWDAGVTLDVIDADADLSSYDVIVVPCLYVCTDTQATRIAEAAQRGAQVVVTYFSGIVDEHDHVRLGGYPGAFSELLGVQVEEFFPLPAGSTVKLDDGSTATTWTEMLHSRGAKTVASYTDGPVAGVPAVTHHEVGEGGAWYVGTALEPAGVAQLVIEVCGHAGLAAVAAGVPAGVEVVRRANADRSFLFIMNHTAEPADVPAEGFDLRHGRLVHGVAHLEPGGVAVIRERG
jgi:beta-galactosidase